jgi:hypothetical protein
VKRRPIAAVALAPLAALALTAASPATGTSAYAAPPRPAPAEVIDVPGPVCPDDPDVPTRGWYVKSRIVDGVTYDIYLVPSLNPLQIPGSATVACEGQ